MEARIIEPHATELRHLSILDGWRALSICLVLAGHLLPIGPASLELNAATATTGMVMFFTLSGFLITRFLIEDGDVKRFIIRRLFRIVPLAWFGVFLAVLIGGGTWSEIFANLLFYANIPPRHALPAASHFWSLSVEVQFYVLIALLVALAGQRALIILPLIAATITILRIVYQEHNSPVTWFRADEILAGATIALIHEGWLGAKTRQWLAKAPILTILPILFASSHPWFGPLNYARPYLSAIMIGASIYSASTWMLHTSRTPIVIYTARVSYSLYVYHGIFAHTWLGSGDTFIRYLKRPLLMIVTIVFSHISTFYYEKRWINIGKRLSG